MKKPIKTKPRNVINKKRLEAKMTQQQLADMVGVTVGFMTNFENGKHGIDFIKGMRLCRVLGIDPEDLYKFLKKHLFDFKKGA